MNHKIVTAFSDNPVEIDGLFAKHLENSPGCTDPKYDWYSLENGYMYFKPLEGEVPDSTGYYRKNQVSYNDVNAAGGAIKLRPSAYITPDGKFHSPEDNKNGQQGYIDEWENWIASPNNPYIESADCTLFDGGKS